MVKRKQVILSRRTFLRLSAIGLPALALAACGDQTSSDSKTLAATTPAQTQAATTAPVTTQAATTAAPVATTASATTQVATTVPAATQVVTTQATTTQPATTQAATSAATTQTPATVASQTQLLAATPQCTDKDEVTIAETEGPYFKASSPERTSLIEPGVPGAPMVLTGYVLSRSCKPVARALLDFWQADGNGAYDNSGFKLRGHQFTDENGRFTLETVVPGLYPGRTRHIHVKVQAPNQPVLTSQLYFPGEARNQSDSIYSPKLLMNVTNNPESKQATFNFVLNLS